MLVTCLWACRFPHARLRQPRTTFPRTRLATVGCGTGILSIFAAQAGAKHVYGIDMSDIIFEARDIVRHNGFADRITLLQGKVEEIKLPVCIRVSGPACVHLHHVSTCLRA